MRKARLALLAVSLTGILLSGCASQATSRFTPADSCVYVAQDGSVSSALVKSYEGQTVEEKDLRQYLEAAVIRYNKENGGQESAQNQTGGTTRLPAAIQSLTVSDGVMKVIFDYASVEDLAKFRQTNDNADVSNTVTAVEVKKTTDADSAGWLSGGKFVKADGAEATPEELKADADALVASVEGGGAIMFSGKVLFMSDGLEKKDDYTVVAPDDQKSFVIFK